MEPVLISACLLGLSCRYDGRPKPLDEGLLAQLKARYHLIPVCPELLGGLSIPRLSAERHGSRVYAKNGADVTAPFHVGAEQTLLLARLFGCRLAILKEKSPSCGAGMLYDGSFTKTLTQGDGVTAALLRENGLELLGESQLERLLTD